MQIALNFDTDIQTLKINKVAALLFYIEYIIIIWFSIKPGSHNIFWGQSNMSVDQPILVQPKYIPTNKHCYCVLKVRPRG